MRAGRMDRLARMSRRTDMPASIFGTRFIGARRPAWHGLGTVFNDPISAEEAAAKVFGEVETILRPMQIVLPDGTVIDADKHAIVRKPTKDDDKYRIFGYASKDYHIVTPQDLAATLNPLTVDWPVETMGSLGHGETSFMTLAAGQSQVAGEELNSYFLITDTVDGGTSIKIAFTPVRVVCQN